MSDQVQARLQAGTQTRAGGLGPAAVPAALVLTGVISIQFGAGLADRLFATVSPAGVTTLRLWAAALIMVIAGWRGCARAIASLARRRSWSDAGIAGAFGISLGIMNFSIYQSFARIPLGVAVTIEFLGPLAVAVAGSRHRRDLAWVALAAIGVLLLTRGSAGHLDLAGIAFALLAAACWAAYILLSKATGQRFTGSSGLVIAMCVAAVLDTGPGIASAGGGLLQVKPLLIAAAIGLLSSAIPYWLELEVLRRMPARVFGVWMSIEPAVAALIGLILLHQRLSLAEWVAIGCVMVACAGASREVTAAP